MKLIAMLHLCPLEEFAAWDTFQRARYEEDLADNLRISHQAGVRHLMVENNFDRELGDSLGDRTRVFEHLLELVCRSLDGTGTTLGVCCRWADWRSTFRFVRQFGLAFCRLPLVGLKVTTRAGRTIEATFDEIQTGLERCGPKRPIVLCDLIPKNCHIAAMPLDLDKRVADLKACGATGLIIGERQSGDYLGEEDYSHIAASQQRWRLPAYVAGSVDDVRARSLGALGVGVVVGGFIYGRARAEPAGASLPRRMDGQKLRRIVAAVYGS